MSSSSSEMIIEILDSEPEEERIRTQENGMRVQIPKICDQNSWYWSHANVDFTIEIVPMESLGSTHDFVWRASVSRSDDAPVDWIQYFDSCDSESDNPSSHWNEERGPYHSNQASSLDFAASANAYVTFLIPWKAGQRPFDGNWPTPDCDDIGEADNTQPFRSSCLKRQDFLGSLI